MRDVYLLGVGMTKFGKYPEIPIEHLGRNAVFEAIKDANINPVEIESAYCGHAFQGSTAGQRVLVELGLTGFPITNLENACASGSTAFREAFYAVASGRNDISLAIGIENLSNKFKGALGPDETDLEAKMGLTMPALYAMRAKRYMYEFGLKKEHLASISVKNHKNALENDRAMFGAKITINEVLKSKMIADPLHKYDCNPVSDGASAALLVSKKVAKQVGGRPIKVLASALTSGKYEPGFINMTFEDITNRCALSAYKTAGVGPEDIDFAEVHDCFTIAEILRVEGIGFCNPGEMISWIEEGKTEINGYKPINPSGGLIGKGHPLGATGVAQMFEIARQLRNEAGDRQINNPRIGLAHCRGGAVAGTEGAACAVHILMKE